MALALWYNLSLFLAFFGITKAFLPSYSSGRPLPLRMGDDGPAGSFFNPVPDNEGSREKKDLDESLEDLLRQRKMPPKASSPSTINGIPTSQATGFGKMQSKLPAKSAQPFVGIGPPDRPLNDVTNPEYDDQGYTLYADEKTGKVSRVFEALVEYPCTFTIKIVGAKEGTFVEDIVQIVADSCQEEVHTIEYTTKVMGKWTSVTVEAPVKNAEMLYMLYENVDRDPRVRFKF